MSSLSKLVRDLRVTLNTAIDLEKEFKEDDKFIDDLETVVKIAKIGFTAATGGALHRLHISKPSIDAVTNLVQRIPDALSWKNDKGQLPIQSAVWKIESVKYVPILAQFGIKHDIGGRGMRGGLLVVDPSDEDNWNTLQLHTRLGNSSDPIPYDTASLDAMKELRKDDLLLKKDIKDHNLLFWSCGPDAKMRFEYLAEWDPDCLMTGTFEGLPLSHAVISQTRRRSR
jgi:hypothetical protein